MAKESAKMATRQLGAERGLYRVPSELRPCRHHVHDGATAAPAKHALLFETHVLSRDRSRGVNPTRHTARRDHRSRYVRREYPVGCRAVRVLFTDASPADERGGVTVVVDSDLMTVFAASARTLTDVSLLEERAIARAILSTSSLPPSTPNHILTDSQAACRRFLFNTLHPTTMSILESFLSSTSHTFRLRSSVMSALMRWPENSHTEPLGIALPSSDRNLSRCLLVTTTDEYFPDAPFLFLPLSLPWSSSMSALRRSIHPTAYGLALQDISNVPPVPNPTLTCWEERLADTMATGQQWLVDRAEAVAATYWAPDYKGSTFEETLLKTVCAEEYSSGKRFSEASSLRNTRFRRSRQSKHGNRAQKNLL
ncbi:hypothetical protein HPB49_012895 [Dermacentor silvarum]|uniref:Uncharacterized protein n=1 Tax=Dermacentor silvarum TaxID=543639 RepID=A0ACB8C3T9_DERSI|nr:hypothetical protein HPB49_012895 [Dermacentor silvarum]